MGDSEVCCLQPIMQTTNKHTGYIVQSSLWSQIPHLLLWWGLSTIIVMVKTACVKNEYLWSGSSIYRPFYQNHSFQRKLSSLDISGLNAENLVIWCVINNSEYVVKDTASKIRINKIDFNIFTMQGPKCPLTVQVSRVGHIRIDCWQDSWMESFNIYLWDVIRPWKCQWLKSRGWM